MPCPKKTFVVRKRKFSRMQEPRIGTLGAFGLVHKVLFVVYTEGGKSMRLISARSATKAEKEIYHQNNINA
jgi:uncharacterized DUF497 family protein